MKGEEIKDHVYQKFLEAIRESFEVESSEMADKCTLDLPPTVEYGDFAIPCFPLAKELRTSPQQISDTLAQYIQQSRDETIKWAESQSGYLNIKIREDVLFSSMCLEALSRQDDFGKIEGNVGEKVMVEYLSPNVNKPLHIGHLRNGALGMATSRLLEATGRGVVKANLINDRGVHICKSMLARKKWAEGATPESEGKKGDHFVGDLYVRFSREAKKDPQLEEEAQQMLQKWEEGDPETIELWKKMNSWVYDGFDKTYENFGLEFDTFLYESETYKMGKDIVEEGKKKDVFYEDENGNTVFELPPEKFGQDKNGENRKITVLRADGTSLYMTQDVATAILKVENHDLDRSIYVVASEQEHHFAALFEILRQLGYSWANTCHHLSYGMVELPEGRMKSREGTVVDADDLIEEVTGLAKKEIEDRKQGELSEEEIKDRAFKIAVGAIKFYLLSVKPKQDINFDPAASISFEGVTGPYCQYAYARISSILKKAQEKMGEIETENADFSLLGKEEELVLVQKLLNFSSEIQRGVEEMNPSRISNYVYNLAKSFHQFYNKHQIIDTEQPELSRSRLALTTAASIAIRNSLHLLDIEAPEKM